MFEHEDPFFTFLLLIGSFSGLYLCFFYHAAHDGSQIIAQSAKNQTHTQTGQQIDGLILEQ